jgi:CubicO group peptidase (beta-lactamase class C family)
MDGRKAAVDLEDLLAMRAGFLWDEESSPVDSPLNSLFALYDAPDWYRFLLDVPMARPPGAAFTYDSGCSVLLGGVLSRATGSPARDFAAASVFAPIGIERFQWDDGSPDACNTGWGLWLRPLDMARIGQLLLRQGSWQGSAVAPAAWVREMFMPRSLLGGGFAYGYQTWLMPLAPGSPAGQYGIQVAWGYGGQFIFIVPALDMVVVSTAGNFLGDGGAIDFIQALLAEAVAD